MKITISKIARVCLVGIIISCNSGEDSTDKQHEHQDKQEVEHDDHYSNLKLNDGERWSANSETTAGIHNMSMLMDEFYEWENPEKYRQLAVSINSELSNIIKECTMQGEAHNQLHKFLVPIKKHLEDLQSGDVKKCRAHYDELKKHLSEYDSYFK